MFRSRRRGRRRRDTVGYAALNRRCIDKPPTVIAGISRCASSARYQGIGIANASRRDAGRAASRLFAGALSLPFSAQRDLQLVSRSCVSLCESKDFRTGIDSERLVAVGARSGDRTCVLTSALWRPCPAPGCPAGRPPPDFPGKCLNRQLRRPLLAARALRNMLTNMKCADTVSPRSAPSRAAN